MQTIKNNITNTIIIKNSKFICYLYKVYKLEEVANEIKKAKEKYKDATHCCYAYIIDNNHKFSDDFEPKGSAGSPIYQVLKNNNLNYVLCIVIRYFGGIKLGASGLIRAYSRSAKEALEKTSIINLTKGKNITIEFDYENIKQIDNILKDEKILSKEYKEKIIYNANVLNNTINLLNNISKITINNDIYIEK